MHLHIVKREVALARGMLRYFSGKPCINGHVSDRNTSDGKCLECRRRRDRKRYPEIKDKVMAKVAEWRERNPEAARRNWEAWYFKDVERTRMMARNTAHRRRERERGGGGLLRSEMTEWALDQEKVCFYCDAECSGEYQLDHVYPIAMGGEHKESNLVIACPDCNRRKGSKDPMRFIEEILNVD